MPNIYFNSRMLPKPKYEYVAFIDMMGTKNKMAKSIPEVANSIFKLHAAIICAWRAKAYQSVFVYPVMDGAYITSGSKKDMENILLRVFRDLANVFVQEKVVHCFIVRGGLSYGEMIHGHNIPYDASWVFERDLPYKNNILLGEPMIDAYLSEGLAAPFGLYIHDNATRGAQGNKHGYFDSGWKWHTSNELTVDEGIVEKMSFKLENYFQEQKILGAYDEEKIDHHRKMAEEYFGKFCKGA